MVRDKCFLSVIVIHNCLLSSSLVTLATAILSCRLYIFVNHFEKKYWSTKQEIREQKRHFSHALLISSIALPHRKRKLDQLHQKSLLLDFEKRKVGVYKMWCTFVEVFWTLVGNVWDLLFSPNILIISFFWFQRSLTTTCSKMPMNSLTSWLIISMK